MVSMKGVHINGVRPGTQIVGQWQDCSPSRPSQRLYAAMHAEGKTGMQAKNSGQGKATWGQGGELPIVRSAQHRPPVAPTNRQAACRALQLTWATVRQACLHEPPPQRLFRRPCPRSPGTITSGGSCCP